MSRYNALDALRLVCEEDGNFRCESCHGELRAESDKFAAQEGGDGDDNARKRRREKLKSMLQKLEVLQCWYFSCVYHASSEFLWYYHHIMVDLLTFPHYLIYLLTFLP